MCENLRLWCTLGAEMRVAVVHDFVLIARAFEQGTRWGCAYKLRRTDPELQTTSDVLDELVCEETFETKQEAEDFAFAEAEAFMHRKATPL